MTFLVLALATYRIGIMIIDESGPFDVLHRLRAISGVEYDEHSTPYGTNVVSEAILCIYCNSVWIGLLSYLLSIANEPLALLLLTPFALSGAAIIIKEIVER